MVPVKKVVTRGYRKCQHFVQRHHLKTNVPIKAQEDNQEVNACLVKNTGCPVKQFTLSGSTLHTSNRYKQSITRKSKEEYHLETILDFDHNHSINSTDLSQKIAKLNFLNFFQRIIHLPLA